MAGMKTDTMKKTPRPPCPYCRHEQGYDEARPSRPRVVTRKAWEQRHKAGHVKTVRETVYDTECRECGKRIVWSVKLGNGSLAQMATGRAVCHWSRP